MPIECRSSHATEDGVKWKTWVGTCTTGTTESAEDSTLSMSMSVDSEDARWAVLIGSGVPTAGGAAPPA